LINKKERSKEKITGNKKILFLFLLRSKKRRPENLILGWN
jgi:hypothetical protein